MRPLFCLSGRNSSVLCLTDVFLDPLDRTQEEEVYYFRSDPRANGATLLLTVDEDSYNSTSCLLSANAVCRLTEGFFRQTRAARRRATTDRAILTP